MKLMWSTYIQYIMKTCPSLWFMDLLKVSPPVSGSSHNRDYVVTLKYTANLDAPQQIKILYGRKMQWGILEVKYDLEANLKRNAKWVSFLC